MLNILQDGLKGYITKFTLYFFYKPPVSPNGQQPFSAWETRTNHGQQKSGCPKGKLTATLVSNASVVAHT